jgi:hypothetical protein
LVWRAGGAPFHLYIFARIEHGQPLCDCPPGMCLEGADPIGFEGNPAADAFFTLLDDAIIDHMVNDMFGEEEEFDELTPSEKIDAVDQLGSIIESLAKAVEIHAGLVKTLVE